MPDNGFEKRRDEFVRSIRPEDKRASRSLILECLRGSNAFARNFLAERCTDTILKALRFHGFAIRRVEDVPLPQKSGRGALPIGSEVRILENDVIPGEDEHSAALRLRYTPPYWRPSPSQKRQPQKR